MNKNQEVLDIINANSTDMEKLQVELFNYLENLNKKVNYQIDLIYSLK
jgi:hypothetical protein